MPTHGQGDTAVQPELNNLCGEYKGFLMLVSLYLTCKLPKFVCYGVWCLVMEDVLSLCLFYVVNYVHIS